jgi:peptidoglycan/LPS O-acetylase OafA/YrhL
MAVNPQFLGRNRDTSRLRPDFPVSTGIENLSARLPSLDGWRALSIVMVLGSHCPNSAGFPVRWENAFRWLFDGHFGVRIFFVLSGLLITWLLLKEDERSGKINMGHFFARRALRILPVYAAFMGALALIQVLTPFRQSVAAWIFNLTFTTNFATDSTWTSGHLWSLAVEEQFYLLWPFLFTFYGLSKNLRLASWVLFAPVLIAPVARVISFFIWLPHTTIPLPKHLLFGDSFVGILRILPIAGRQLLSPSSFFCYFDSLAIGCLCAFALKTRVDVLREWANKAPNLILGTALALIGIPYVMDRIYGFGFPIFTIPFGFTLQGFGIGILVLHSVVSPRRLVFRILNHRTVVEIGALSYSIYIWQQIYCTKPEAFGIASAWWLRFPFWLLAAAGTAVASYYVLERPLFRLRSRFR